VGSNRAPRLVIAAALLLLACKWNLTQAVLHPTVEQRVNECLSGTIPWPGPVQVNPDSFRFAVLTDPHFGKSDTLDVTGIRAEFNRLGVDFFLVLGDLVHDGLADEYSLAVAMLDSIGLPYYSTIGNHDLYQADGWQQFKERFGPSCYVVTVGDQLKLIFLDTAEGAIGPTQFDWLDDELADTTVTKLVATHYPLYDGSMPGPYRLSSTAERNKLQHLLTNHHVPAIVSGHVHAWRHTAVDGVDHFIAGSMSPGALDYGDRGMLVFTFARDSLAWTHVPFPTH